MMRRSESPQIHPCGRLPAGEWCSTDRCESVLPRLLVHPGSGGSWRPTEAVT